MSKPADWRGAGMRAAVILRTTGNWYLRLAAMNFSAAINFFKVGD